MSNLQEGNSSLNPSLVWRVRHRAGEGRHQGGFHDQTDQAAANADDHQRFASNFVDNESSYKDSSMERKSRGAVSWHTRQVASNTHGDPATRIDELFLGVEAEGAIKNRSVVVNY